MEKRYQVFVSSTYADLKEERQHVIQALMEMDCIPAGMELFPAADVEQWEFIKRVIDDCDYYLLIIGGRYGSTTDDGISYTEKEFDYAVENGLKVVALIHGEPDDIPFGKSEKDEGLRNKLFSFRDKVMNGRLVKFWTTSKELPGLVALSMTKTIKMYPATGWVRANNIDNEDILVSVKQKQKEDSYLDFKKKKLPSDILETVDLGNSLSFVKDLLGSPKYIRESVISDNDENITTNAWFYEFFNAELSIESDDGESVSVITLQVWDEDELFTIPIFGNMKELTIGSIVNKCTQSREDLIYWAGMRDNYVQLQCDLGRLSMYRVFTLGTYNAVELIGYRLENNTFVSDDGEVFDLNSLRINYVSIAYDRNRGHPIG